MTEPFALDGPLPEGTVVIEASAGTGKTYSLAALATRLVAETGLRASELLVVTFTRAATAELRDRIRERIAESATFLAELDPDDDGARVASDDLLHAHLGRLPERARIIADLERAVAEFDAATISTIHGFATQILGLIGLDDADDGVLTDDSADLTRSVCADVLASASADGVSADHLPDLDELVELIEVVFGRPGIGITPFPDPEVVGDDHLDAARVMWDLVRACEQEIRHQRRRLGQRSFDDVLTLLRDELVSDRAEVVTRLVRSRYRAALIDEFQDTDPVQWAIFEALFADDPSADLVLVGDPKQAIYGFRGADVNTYLDAVRNRSDTRSLTANWRSDGAAIAAVDRLFDGVTFGTSEIGFTPVEASESRRTRRLRRLDGRTRPGLQIRHRTNRKIANGTKKVGADLPIPTDAARRAIADDLADVLIDLLDDGCLPCDHDDITPADAEICPDGHRRVRPSDIAVLVTTSAQGDEIRRGLLERSIPAVLARGSSVLDSPAAEQWRWLLHAVARPADASRARLFALSWFGGHGVRSLDQASDEQIAEIQHRLWEWSMVLGDRGTEAFLAQVLDDSRVVPRVLAAADGDRNVTDLEHVAELLRTGPATERTSPAGLLSLLDPDRTNTSGDVDGDPSSRRVASEDDAVQIMTVHVAKGLEFPIVCCPTLWTDPSNSGPTVYSDDDGRHVDILRSARWPTSRDKTRRTDARKIDSAGERLRLLYVALTRARHQTIVWWARVWGGQGSALTRVLFGRDDTHAIDPIHLPQPGAKLPTVKLPTEEICLDRLRALADLANEASGLDDPVLEVVAVEQRSNGEPWQLTRSGDDAPELDIARLEHPPPRTTARWSFSAISARADDHRHDQPITVADRIDPLDDEPAEVDEPVEPHPLDPDSLIRALASDTVSPLAPLPAGASFGLLVHAVYEHVDFTAPEADLRAEIDDRIGRELSWRSVDLTPQILPGADRTLGRRRLVDGIVATLRTPLGADLGNLRLDQLQRRDRLDELSFDLHLPEATAPVTDTDLGQLLLARLPADDPYRPWAKQLADGVFGVDLAGHLTGSIDLVMRIPDPSGPDRYIVCDYKTNRLHDPSTAPTPDDYGPQRLVDAMTDAHYPLQALLYSVALHRHLRWRLAGYDPAVHLGGIAYLFVRGMAGPGTARTDGGTHGVARWSPPPAAITATSDALAGVPVTELLPEGARP